MISSLAAILDFLLVGSFHKEIDVINGMVDPENLCLDPKSTSYLNLLLSYGLASILAAILDFTLIGSFDK